MNKRKPFYKVLLTDLAGISLLLLVPILGPIPGPGGIPLTISGLGLLAINHVWAQNLLHYVKKHSDSLRSMIFPDKKWVMWSWDIAAVFIMIIGIWMNIAVEWWLLKGLSVGVMAGSTTLFILNRNRITWLDKQIRRNQ